MRRLPLLLLLASAAILPGCAGWEAAKDAVSGLTEMVTGKDNAEPPKELSEEFSPKAQLATSWTVKIGDGAGEENINLVPAVTEDSVYAIDHKGLIVAVNRLTGEKRWEVETEIPFVSGPTLSKDKLIVGTGEGELIAYSQADGTEIWRASLPSAVLDLPAIDQGFVVARGTDGKISALKEKDGTVEWTHERTAPTLSVRSKGGPIIVDDLVIDGFGGGKLIALRLKNGQREWESLVALSKGRAVEDRLLDLNAPPFVKSDTIYVSGFQANVAAVAIRNGDVDWREEKISTHTGLSGNRRSLFLSDNSSDVWRLEIRNGSDLWKQDELHQRRLTMPVIVKEKLVVGDFEGYVHILSQDDGALLAREQIESSPIEAAPVVYNDMIYVYTLGGKLAALTVD